MAVIKQYNGGTTYIKPIEISCRYPGGVSEFKRPIRNAFILIGMTIIAFAAFGDTLTFQLQRFWEASGHFWQHQWDKVFQISGRSNYNLFVFGIPIVSYAIFWSACLAYTFMDFTGLPKFIRRYKVQPGTNEPVDKWMFFKGTLLVNFNLIAVSLPTTMLFYRVLKYRGFNGSSELPLFQWILFELLICILVEEIGFYYGHRAFHHPLTYKWFHKIHHEWQAPIAITALYSHPVEYLFTNLMPILIGPLITGSHISTIIIWNSLSILMTLHTHSGYHLPFMPSPEAHDYHHLKFNQCYGVIGVLDYLHGTDDKFRKSKQFDRHVIMLSLIPPRDIYPDDNRYKQENKMK